MGWILCEYFTRTEWLIGTKGIQKLRNARIAVFGVGGVGGYVVEALARSGVGSITVFDRDTIAPSNLNRQIIATVDNIGRDKVDVIKERILSINPSCEVNVYKCFYMPENAESYDLSSYNYVVDAIDTVTAKIELAVRTENLKIPFISCMGTGNKLDPAKLKVTDISKTRICPLARVMRRELRKRGILHLKVLYSDEEPIKNESCFENGKMVPGSVAFVPSVAGLMIAAEVVRDIVREDDGL